MEAGVRWRLEEGREPLVRAVSREVGTVARLPGLPGIELVAGVAVLVREELPPALDARVLGHFLRAERVDVCGEGFGFVLLELRPHLGHALLESGEPVELRI